MKLNSLIAYLNKIVESGVNPETDVRIVLHDKLTVPVGSITADDKRVILEARNAQEPFDINNYEYRLFRDMPPSYYGYAMSDAIQKALQSDDWTQVNAIREMINHNILSLLRYGDDRDYISQYRNILNSASNHIMLSSGCEADKEIKLSVGLDNLINMADQLLLNA